MESMFCGFGVI